MFDRFWNYFRKAAPSTASAGSAPIPMQRMAQWGYDHYNESLQFKGWTFVAVNTKCTIAGMSDWRLFTTSDGVDDYAKAVAADVVAKTRNPLDENHELYRLLAKPNPVVSRKQFLYQMCLQLSLTGSLYVWERDGEDGKQLWVLPTGLVQYRAATLQFPEGSYFINESTYGNSIGYGYQAEIDARKVIRVNWPSPLTVWEGTSAVSAGSYSVDIAKAMDEATWASFNNEVRGGVLLSVDPSIRFTEAQMAAVEEKLRAMKGGRFNQGSTIILQGVTAQQTSRSPSEIDYGDSRPRMRDEIFAYHGVSSIAAGVTGTTTYAEYVAAIKTTIEIGVQPMLDLIADCFERRFESRYGEGLEIELAARSPSDSAETRANYELLARHKAITVNELRKQFGLPEIPGGDTMVASTDSDTSMNQEPNPNNPATALQAGIS